MVCRHVHDRTTSNNRLSNLAWGTYAENSADMVRHGTLLSGPASPQYGKPTSVPVTKSYARARRLGLRDEVSDRLLGDLIGVALP